MILIGLSGKIGCGKSTLAKHLARRFPGAVILSFGNPIKEETAAFFEFDSALCYSEAGKDAVVTLPPDKAALFGADRATVRELVQWYGTDYRRVQNPHYWLWAMDHALVAALADGAPAAIIDDVRFPDEVNLVLGWTHGQVYRLDPYPGWKPGSHADHESETALDDWTDWTGRFRPLLGELDVLADEIAARVGV
jgi:hypothetical protein